MTSPTPSNSTIGSTPWFAYRSVDLGTGDRQEELPLGQGNSGNVMRSSDGSVRLNMAGIQLSGCTHSVTATARITESIFKENIPHKRKSTESPEPSSSSSSSRMSSSRSEQTASSGSIFDYDPVQLIYSCMDGTPNISSILSGTSNPNLSHSLKGNRAHFMFYDSDYYFTLKPGVTYVRGCEETMQLAVTDPDRSVRIIDPHINMTPQSFSSGPFDSSKASHSSLSSGSSSSIPKAETIAQPRIPKTPGKEMSINALIASLTQALPKNGTPIDKRTVYWKEGGYTTIIRFLDQTDELRTEIRSVGITVSGKGNTHQPTLVGKKIKIITSLTHDRTVTTKLSDLDYTSNDFTEIDIIQPSSSSHSSSASNSSSMSSSKSSYSSSSSGSSSSITKTEKVAQPRIPKTFDMSIDDKETISSVTKYNPYSITYNHVKGKKPTVEITKTNTHPKLSCLVREVDGLAWFKFFNSDYYVNLQPGNTFVNGCEKTMKLTVTHPNRTVTSVEPSTKL